MVLVRCWRDHLLLDIGAYVNDTVPQTYDIEMPTGHYLDVSGGRWSAVVLYDVAHKLAQTNRFGGATFYPYSVAQHAVLVARRAMAMREPVELCYAALHHDDGEYVATDIQKPIKLWIGENRLGDLEALWQYACEHTFKVPKVDKKTIKEYDTWAVLVEARELLPSRGKHWQAAASQRQWRLQGGKLPETGLRTPSYWRGELNWRDARDEYLELHFELKGAIDGSNR